MLLARAAGASLPGTTPGQAFRSEGVQAAACSAWLRTTATAPRNSAWVSVGVARSFVMKINVQKPHKRRALKSLRLWLMRPSTIRLAFALVSLVSEIAKVIDKF